jgi:hypothetical protein
MACEAVTDGRGLPGRFSETTVDNARPSGGRHEVWATRTARLVMHAGFARPSDEYDHRILGAAQDSKVLTIHLRQPGDNRITCPAEVILPEGEVFEDIAPRLADLDGDGMPEVIVVHTDIRRGARLAVYDRRARLVAATPHIGQTHRWLAPLGVADLDGDGAVEIAYVDRPHLAKVLRIWRFRGGRLVHVADAPGLTNHRIGWDHINGGIRDCGTGAEVVLESGDWGRLMAARLVRGRIETRDLGPWSDAAERQALECK